MGEASTKRFPKFLYRYRLSSSPYFLDEIARLGQREIFLPSARFLNDPFDCNPRFVESSTKEVMEEIKSIYGRRPMFGRRRYEELLGKKVSDREWKRVSKTLRPGTQNAKFQKIVCNTLFREFRSHARVACFSEVSNSVLMWSHYAGGHTGVCIEYTVKEELFGRFENTFPLDVIYTAVRSAITTADFIRFTDGSQTSSVANNERITRAPYYEKAEEWSYEKEWRIVDNDTSEPRYHRVMALVPHAVILGVSFPEDLESELGSVLGDLGVAISRARQPELAYGIEVEQVVKQP